MTKRRRECAHCGTVLPVGVLGQRRYCGEPCRKQATRIRWREHNPITEFTVMSPSAIAQLVRMRVALDLMRRGMDVYMAVCVDMECDFIVVRQRNTFDVDAKPLMVRETLRVRAVAGGRTSGGTLRHRAFDDSKYDVLAVVVEEAVIYKPEW